MTDLPREPSKLDDAQKARLRQWSVRKPCIALMGEFSAGKSTLLNFLIESQVLPTRATATELPPVWFSHGAEDAYWVDAEGERHPVALDALTTVPMHARYVRMHVEAEILEHCDIVDTPGISDPNLEAESWRFAAGMANLVLWCSSATQAWRETERATWASLPERLRRHSLLIVTRADKLLTAADRDKVARRLARETVGMFHASVFLSTPDAVKAKASLPDGGTSDLWESSGASQLLDRLAERFEAIYEERHALCERHMAWADGISVRRRRPVSRTVQPEPAPETGLEPLAQEVEAAARAEAETPPEAGGAEVAPAAPLGAGVVPVRPSRPQLDGTARRPERPRLVASDEQASGAAGADPHAPLVLDESFGVVKSPLHETDGHRPGAGAALEEGAETGAEIAAEAESEVADLIADVVAADARAEPEAEAAEEAGIETAAEPADDAEADLAAESESEPAAESEAERADGIVAEAEPEPEIETAAEPADDAEAEAEDEAKIEAVGESEPVDEAEAAPAEGIAAAAGTAAELPAEVALWRALVAGRAAEMSGAEVVALIDEFLCRLYGGGATADGSGDAPEPADAQPVAEPEAESEPAAPGKTDSVATGWRRLA